MKYLSFFALIVLAGACRYHSITGSGHIVTENRHTESFMGIHAAAGVHVEIKKGAETSVTVEADDNVQRYVETKVSGNTLDVRLRDMSNLTNVTLNIYITAPELKEINASAGADISGKDVITTAGEMMLKASSGAKVQVEVDAPSVVAEASSGAGISASGRTKAISADASSGANIHASSLRAEKVTASASSSGSIHIFASLSIDGNASSGGNIHYTGGAANVVKNESSGGSVSAGN